MAFGFTYEPRFLRLKMKKERNTKYTTITWVNFFYANCCTIYEDIKYAVTIWEIACEEINGRLQKVI